ncbi:MAG: zinc-ribbon domain-containing protein [Ruminococcaceae bacterium]|nr:zinc-ribbon domain-containing protein [Oscillospiraceae bacterium]
MYCPSCGTQLPDSAAFCGKCGQKLTKTSQKIEDFNGDETVKVNPAVNAPRPQQPPSFQQVPQQTAPINSIPYQGNNQNRGIPPQGNQNRNIPHQRGPVNYGGGNPDIPPTNGYNQVKANPMQAPPSEKKKGGAGKIALIIIIAVLVAAIVGISAFGITLLLGARNKIATTEETTVSYSDETEINELIYSDPIQYFNTQTNTYYKVSNNPDADKRIFASYEAKTSLGDTLTENDLIYVYGTENGWACFSYTENGKKYAWCKADAVFKTDEVPSETETVPSASKYDDPIAYFANQPDAYYRVYNTGSQGLNLRTADNTDAEVTRILQETEIVLVYGIEDGWAYVVTADSRTASGSYGWCSAEFLNFYKEY